MSNKSPLSTVRGQGSNLPDIDAERTPYSRVRVANSTGDLLRAFIGKYKTTNDDAIVCLIQAYEQQTQYRYSSETGHLIAELHTLYADLARLAKLNLRLMEMICVLQQSDYQAMATWIDQTANRA